MAAPPLLRIRPVAIPTALAPGWAPVNESLGIMRSIVGVVVAMFAITCAKTDEPCLKTDNARFNAAIPPELAAKGIKHRFDDQRGVCADKKDAAALEAAYRRITMYGSEVAALLSDECEQRDLVGDEHGRGGAGLRWPAGPASWR